jgi:hypothetical protein
MGKYEALGQFLKDQHADRVPMTFAEIERITGVKLPPSARKHRPWWSNNPTNSVMTKIWLDAGFESEQVDMAARKLVFRRVRAKDTAVPRSLPRHPAFGALKGMVTVAPGVDLTEPADPEWGEILERDD